MVDYLTQLFGYLTQDEGYKKSVEDITYVVKNIVYSMGNIKIVFTCELMENSFDFEIFFSSQGNNHSVCEWKGKRKMHYQNIGLNVIHHDIFEYTKGIWDSTSFQDAKETLLHKKYGIGRSTKFFHESADLYKSLLTPAIEEIEKVAEK